MPWTKNGILRPGIIFGQFYLGTMRRKNERQQLYSLVRESESEVIAKPMKQPVAHKQVITFYWEGGICL